LAKKIKLQDGRQKIEKLQFVCNRLTDSMKVGMLMYMSHPDSMGHKN